MKFESFAQMLTAELDLEVEVDVELETCTGLFDDLGLDSFQAFEMLVIIEMAAGLDSTPPELPIMLTLGDAYDYYQYIASTATPSLL